jgi:hypothetical protein
MGLVVALVVGLVVLLVALLGGLVLALRSTTSVVDRLGQRLRVLEHDAAQLREALGAVDEDLGRVADALDADAPDSDAPDSGAADADVHVPEAHHG